MRSSTWIKLVGLCSVILIALAVYAANTINNLTTDQFHVSGATATTVPYFDANKKLVSSGVTPTTLGYLDATSSIQTQLNALALPSQTGQSGNFLTTNGTSTSWATVSSGSGTVTSVTFTGDGTVLSSTPSTAVTTSGTLAATLLTQSANTVLAGPTTGSSASPTFRSLVSADIPSLSYLPLSGGTMSGAITMASHQIHTVTDPTSAQDAATKNYVDTQLAQLNPAAAVYAASTTNIAGTYVNSVSGVCIGDTFTTTSTTNPFTVDGATPSVGSRVLLKNQTSSFQDGVWTLTTQAVGGVSGAIFTRALDFDSSTDINAGTIVPVQNGSQAGSSWYQTAVNTTCNTSSQTWTMFQQPSSAYLLAANNLSDVASASTAINNIMPSQTGESGEFLTTNGTSVSWGVPSPVFSGLNTNGVMYATASNAVSTTTVGSAGQVLTSNGTGNAPTYQAAPGAPTTVSKTSAYNVPASNYNVIMSGSSWSVGLPDATVYTTGDITLIHHGTSLSQIYTITTTSGQTINGANGAIASGNFFMTTNGETLVLTSNGANWFIKNHKTDTPWTTDTTATIQYITFTTTSANATIAATYAPAYVFTITAGNTASVGAIYSNNGNNYTLAVALTSGQTTLVTTGGAAPTSSGTLTYVSGTHTGGNITFSAVAGNPDISTTVYTIAKTAASQTTIIAQGIPTSVNPNASGQLVKVSGTGDAVIVYSSFTGTAVNSVSATTTSPVYYGSPSTNLVQWSRSGNMAKISYSFYQSVAGASAGSGDYIFSVPLGMTIDSTIVPLSTGGAVQTNITTVPGDIPGLWPSISGGASNATNLATAPMMNLYSGSQFRIYTLTGSNNVFQAIGSANYAANSIMAYNFQIIVPISGWQP